MTQSLELRELRATLSGVVVDPASPEYDEVRKVWNADHDRRPAVIARCASTADVVAAVGFARDAGLEIAVRGGAHSLSGMSTVDDGLVIDLSGMNQVSVDPHTKRARVQGGALLADLDAATQAHGLAVPTGVVGHTGIGGITLGGGMGWLTRQAGLTIDNLESAEIVLADGRVVRADGQHNADLFWAIRGGGGNFGVVTEFEFRLHEVGPTIQFGLFFWEMERGVEALQLMREVVADLSPSCSAIVAAALTAPPAPFVPEQHQNTLGHSLLLVGFGPADEHEQVISRIRTTLPPLFDYVEPMPYVALQQFLDEANAWGFYGHDKGAYIEELTDGVIEAITEYTPQKSSPLSVLLFYRLDQAYCDVGEDDTAFSGGRSPRYMLFLVALAPNPELLVADRAWIRSIWDSLRPHMISRGTYVNTVIEEDDRIRESYGQAKYHGLAEIKAQYDPGNLFRRNVNIKPL